MTLRGPQTIQRTHGWSLPAAKLSRLNVGRDRTRPHEGVTTIPRGRQAGWGGRAALVASPHCGPGTRGTGGGFAAGLAGSRSAEPRVLARLHAHHPTFNPQPGPQRTP